MSCGANYIVPGADPCGGGGGLVGVLSLNSLQGDINITSSDGTLVVTAPGPTGVDVDITTGFPFIAQYFYEDNQPTISGQTTLSEWNIQSPWSNVAGCVQFPIYHTGVFTILKIGVYQIDLTVVISGNSGTWSATDMKSCGIEINRGGGALGVYQQTHYVPSELDHTIQATCVVVLDAGDTFRPFYNGTFILGTPLIVPYDGNVGINTNLVWRYIMSAS